MRTTRLWAALVFGCVLGLSGCALALVGAGVAGGYAISKDSVRNTFDLSKDHVYRQSLAVAEEMGMVKTEDAKRGIIKLDIGNANVTISVKPLTRKAVELKVQARNNLMLPEISTAQDVYNKIIERL